MNEWASLHALGALQVDERERLAALMRERGEFRALVDDLSEVAAKLAVAFAVVPPEARPSRSDLRAALLGAVDRRVPSEVTNLFELSPEEAEERPIVLSDPDNYVRWVSPAFSAMCGHGLEELRGKKIAGLLRGPESDPRAAESMRRAVVERRPVTERIVNYHKSGTAYEVEIAIRPLLRGGRSLGFVALERKLG